MNPRPLPNHDNHPNYAHVLSICRRLLQPPIDYENVAQQILYECLRAGVSQPSTRIIRARCASAIQSERRRMHHELISTLEKDEPQILDRINNHLDSSAPDPVPGGLAFLASLLRRAELTSAERAALHARYWQGHATTNELNGHREALRSALRKLRKVEL